MWVNLLTLITPGGKSCIRRTLFPETCYIISMRLHNPRKDSDMTSIISEFPALHRCTKFPDITTSILSKLLTQMVNVSVTNIAGLQGHSLSQNS